MKRLTKGILTVGLALTMATGFAACSEAISAYDIAVENGFQGTEAEWLASLHGANGEDGKDLDALDLYEQAVAAGEFSGSFMEFCATLHIDAPKNNDTAQIAENTLSVVSIYCQYTETSGSGGLFGTGAKKEYGSQAGSGVIVDLNKQAGNAYILTNYHVIYNLDSDQKGILDDIWVYPYGSYRRFDTKEGDVQGDGIKATFVGGAMDYDIAILKVEGSEYLRTHEVREAKMGNSDDVQVGEQTFVIGNPEGAGISVTNGVVSVPSEYISMYALDNRDEDGDRRVDTIPYRVIRTSAAINGGNSGGGMFNARGELIGIVNAKNAQSTTDNMGYALPITQVKAIYENILDNGGKAVQQARLGVIVSLKSSTPVVDEDGKLTIFEEFCVSTAAEKGEAAYQKLRVGDVFLSAKINDDAERVFTLKYQLTDLLLTVRKGDTVTFTVRDSSGREKQVPITFGEGNFTTYA